MSAELYCLYLCIYFSNDNDYRSGTVDSMHGPTRNIWGSQHKYEPISRDRTMKVAPQKIRGDDFYITGGSSGGSAVAVASGCVLG